MYVCINTMPAYLPAYLLGVYVGVDGVDNNWAGKVSTNKHIVNPLEWHKYAKSRGLQGFMFRWVTPISGRDVCM